MRDEKIQEIRGQLESYLQRKGINTRKNFTCLAGTHADKNPSMSYKDDRVKCFSCDASMDIFDLIGVEYGITDFSEQLKKASEITGIYDYEGNNTPLQSKPQIQANNTPKPEEDDSKYQDKTDYINTCIARVNQTNYLKDRGLTDETIESFKLGYDPSFNTRNADTGEYDTWQVIIIPTSNKSYVARNIDPLASSGNRIRKYGHAYNYNLSRLKDKKPVFIVEGEIDAMSIEQLGYNAIGLGGKGNYTKFYNALEQERAGLPTLILALDNDEAGQVTNKQIAEVLEKQGIDFIISNPYGEFKDANECLNRDYRGIKKELEEVYSYASKSVKERQAEEYKKQATSSYIADFINGITDSVNTPYIPTGFKTLDYILDGGLYEGLYILGAISSLGKTTLVMQIADQIAIQGHDVLIFSLEMARTELMAKTISRLTLINAVVKKLDRRYCKTTRGITTASRYQYYEPEEMKLIEESIKEYGEFAKNIYIHEGLGNIGVEYIKQQVEKHIKFTGKRPIVIIDYLQILAPYDMRQTEKQATDKNVMELKRLSRDAKIPVFGISSFNRENYKNEVSMTAFKESGAIEYGSDVLIGLQFEGQGESGFKVDEAKGKDPRKIEIKILKNRNGKTGSKISMNYIPMFNYFEEV